jgi:NAD(P)-dependent dehydrogenase (short-subunit alcohol dehydrogenase family)/glyoxylase-like metal-dependent hydrolase (beta-lactamase superfamily II)
MESVSPVSARAGAMRRAIRPAFARAVPLMQARHPFRERAVTWLALCAMAAFTSTGHAQAPAAAPQRAVLVTGASSGIGRAITERLAADGHFVYATARKPEDLAALSRIPNVEAIRLDVNDPAQIAGAVERVAMAGRGLYGLVNNAGVAVVGELTKLSDADFDYQMQANVYGPFRITRAFAPLIVEARGRITTIGSISGILSTGTLGAYSMSKHAMEAFADSLAVQMQPLGVAVSIVEPGNYDSRITATAERRQGGSLGIADRSRFKPPGEVAEAVARALFDANPKRRYLVVPNASEGERTIRTAIDELVQLNEGHPYTYERAELIQMLDAALANARPKVPAVATPQSTSASTAASTTLRTGGAADTGSASTSSTTTAAGTALPVPVTGHDVTELGPGYYTFRYKGTRNIFLITSGGVIATDPIEPEAARLMREEIRKRTALPIEYVVYSHQHWDHVRGGRIFAAEGAKFVSHANCLAHFRDLPEPEIVMPNVTFARDRYDLKLGDRTLRLQWLGTNHGDCLIVMTPDHVNIPFIVDLASPGGMPLPFIPDYSLHNWVRTLRELESWDFRQYVGGHGVPLADKSRLGERREYVEALMQETRREWEAGTAVDRIPEIVAARLQPRFAYLRGFNGIVRDNVRRTLSYYGMGW